MFFLVSSVLSTGPEILAGPSSAPGHLHLTNMVSTWTGAGMGATAVLRSDFVDMLSRIGETTASVVLVVVISALVSYAMTRGGSKVKGKELVTPEYFLSQAPSIDGLTVPMSLIPRVARRNIVPSLTLIATTAREIVRRLVDARPSPKSPRRPGGSNSD